MKILLSAFLLLIFSIAVAQKKPVDFLTSKNWPRIQNEKISDDGKFILYTLSNEGKREDTLVIQAVDNSWKKEFNGILPYTLVLSDDNKQVFYQFKDTLNILTIGADYAILKKAIPQITSFNLAPGNGGQYLFYKSIVTDDLVVYNFKQDIQRTYPPVKEDIFSANGKSLILLQQPDKDSVQDLHWIDLKTGSDKMIWRGTGASGFSFDSTGTKLAFLVNDGKQISIDYFKEGQDEAINFVNQGTDGITDSEQISPGQRPEFSLDGDQIFFNIERRDTITKKLTGVNVDIWNGQDRFLQSQQLRGFGADRYLLTVYNIGQHKIIQLQKKGDQTDVLSNPQLNSKYILLQSSINTQESRWNPEARPSFYLASTLTGERKVIASSVLGTYPQMSPSGKYVVWYNAIERNYFIYDIAEASIVNISQNGKTSLSDELNDHPTEPFPYGIAGWLKQDSSILLYDRYDIWKIDLTGKKSAANITEGFGRKHKIVLRLPSGEPAGSIDQDSPMVISGFNEINKDNGFFMINLAKPGEPGLLTMNGKVFGSLPQISPLTFQSASISYRPILLKAKHNNTWLLTIMGSTEFPNLVSTTDFKNYTQLTDFQPQKTYNWLNTRLIHYQLPAKKKGEGILYLPEDFNPRKKYPVIFYFYEKLSNTINDFFYPDLSSGDLNIAYYASNGYIVCVPDMYYKPDFAGEGALNSVIGAEKYLAAQPWADTTKMGLQGHSFGGYEVNYIVSHSDLFKAAVSASGISDLVSLMGSVKDFGNSNYPLVEGASMRMGTMLWQNKMGYVSNSPIFSADRINTPLLLMANQKDGNVSWQQGYELYMALRRMQKKVWMLQYDGEEHNLRNEQNKLDYSIRMKQFFDHYLKEAPAPFWMTKGVSAEEKGKETGYELDRSNTKL